MTDLKHIPVKMSASNRLEPHTFESSRPRQIVQPRSKRILASAGQRLSTIVEHATAPIQAPPPPNSFGRKVLAFANPLQRSNEKRPQISEFSTESDSTISTLDIEKNKGLAENKHIAKRGGWTRLTILILLSLLIILALGLGIGFGLKRKTSSSTSTTNPASNAITSSPANPTTTGVPPSSPEFPTGSYSLTTYLSSVQTNCTANPATWTCFPYTTYAANPNGSITAFNWDISSSSSNNTHLVSSSHDPFALTFPAQPLTLLDPGQPSERYTFSLTLPKQVAPSAAIAPNGAAATCFYNASTLTASLYTRMAPSYPIAKSSGDGEGGGGGGPSYTEWPFAVRVEQNAEGGLEVPDCYEMNGDGQVGTRITAGLVAQPANSECSCVYQNFDAPT